MLLSFAKLHIKNHRCAYGIMSRALQPQFMLPMSVDLPGGFRVDVYNLQTRIQAQTGE